MHPTAKQDFCCRGKLCFFTSEADYLILPLSPWYRLHSWINRSHSRPHRPVKIVS